MKKVEMLLGLVLMGCGLLIFGFGLGVTAGSVRTTLTAYDGPVTAAPRTPNVGPWLRLPPDDGRLLPQGRGAVPFEPAVLDFEPHTPGKTS